eukprot:Skav231281  [mRNA]  locus=scaffold161:80488:80949:+ [translate_table: standard]
MRKKRMFEEVHYTCTFTGTVQARSTPELSNCEAFVKNGQGISALPAVEHQGWLLEAGSKLYYPINNPKTIQNWRCFKAFKAIGASGTGDVEQGKSPDTTDDTSCEQVAAVLSCCIPWMGASPFASPSPTKRASSRESEATFLVEWQLLPSSVL